MNVNLNFLETYECWTFLFLAARSLRLLEMLKSRETVEVMLPARCQEIGDKVHKVDTAINVLISAGLSSPSLRFLDSTAALDFNAITSRSDIGIDHGLNLGVVFLGLLLTAL